MVKREFERVKKWLDAIDTSNPIAVIMGGTVGGLSFVRSLGSRGVPSLLLESSPKDGRYSRYGKYHILPFVEDFPESWVEFLKFVSSHTKVPPVIFPTSDIHSLFVSRYADVLRPLFRFILPDRKTLEKIAHKRFQYDMAQKIGIPYPKTYSPDNGDTVRNIAKNIPYPCILKPCTYLVRITRLTKKVLVIHSPEELISRFESLANEGDSDFLIQEIIPGADDQLFGYLAFWDHEHGEIAWLTKKKLRQNPPNFGDGSCQITVDVPEVADLSRRLLGELNYCGFVSIEYKFDLRDKTYKLMEVNPRTAMCNQMPISAGVDFPWVGYQYLVNPNFDKNDVKLFRPGIKWVHEIKDIKSFLALHKNGDLSFSAWIKSVRGTSSMALWRWDDPLPLIMQMLIGSRALLRKLWNRRQNKPLD